MLRRLLAAMLLFGICFGVSGCGNQLTNSSAVGLLQKYEDTHNAFPAIKSYVVESCNNIVLTNETSAQGKCQEHAVMTAAGQEIRKGQGLPPPAAITVRATFGKQTDGTWIATGSTDNSEF